MAGLWTGCGQGVVGDATAEVVAVADAGVSEVVAAAAKLMTVSACASGS